MSDLY